MTCPRGTARISGAQPGGFVGDPDVMDTWATSSLSPQIAGRWGTDLFSRVFPMDLRPQAHDIIRTWLFSTIVRSHFQFDSLPFSDTLISGFILDPDRKKMSKSIGNTVTPMPLVEQYGADALRYWAAGGRPGSDTAFDEGQLKIGRRLGIKILNASKFVLGRLDGAEIPAPTEVTEPIDLDLLALLAELITAATDDFENYDYARALERTESFFWSFCDDYVELVKIRAYGETDDAPTRSARATLAITLSVLQRLFAPIMPFVTDEVWRWWHRPLGPRVAVADVEGVADARGHRRRIDLRSGVRSARSDSPRQEFGQGLPTRGGRVGHRARAGGVPRGHRAVPRGPRRRPAACDVADA